MEDAYSVWLKQKTPETLAAVVKQYLPAIRKNTSMYQGAVSKEILESEGKRLAIDAIKSYNPKAGASLGTHITNHLQRLNRITQSRARAFRMPEDIQRQAREYAEAQRVLAEELGREPSIQEISEHLKLPVTRIEKLQKQMVQEASEGSQVYEGATNMPMDERLLYVYHDLTPRDQLIFEHLTGFGGKPIMKKSEIAKKIKVSPAVVTQRSIHIHKQLKGVLGLGS